MEHKFKKGDKVFLRGDVNVIYTIDRVKSKNNRLKTWWYDILGPDNSLGTDIDEIELKSADSNLKNPIK